MLVFLCPLGYLRHSNVDTQPPRRLCKPHSSNYAPFSKKHTTSNSANPPPPHNLTPRIVLILTQRYSQLWKKQPLGDITRSDVKDVAANNNTKQLFTEVVPRRKVVRLTTRFYTFPPYILFKRRQGTRQFYPTKFIE